MLHSNSSNDNGAEQLSIENITSASNAVEQAITKSIDKGQRLSKGWIPSQKDQEVFGQKSWSELLSVYDVVKRSVNRRVRTANKYGIQSVGNVVDGYMVGSTTLPLDGEHYRVMPVHRKRHTNYGTSTLVKLVDYTANFVAKEHPGAKMSVGNMANQYGGDLYWSRSHNTGRDVDIFFYVKRKSTDQAAMLPFFQPIDDNGVSTKDKDILFDVPKNWSLIKGLITNDFITIQRLFISRGLRKLLLDYAKSQNEPQWIIDRATEVVKQPATSPPHNDHLHVRIACPANDRLFGCLELGPKYKWGDWHTDTLRREAMLLSKVFTDPTATNKDKVDVLDMLDETENPNRLDVALIWGITDPHPEVAKAALPIIRTSWPNSPSQATLAVRGIERLRSAESSNKSTTSLPLQDAYDAYYTVLRKSLDPTAWDFAIATLRSPERSLSEKIAAANTLRYATDARYVKELIDLLPNSTPRVAAAIETTLRYITMLPDKRRKLADWTKWFAANGEKGNDAWRLTGVMNEIYKPGGKETSIPKKDWGKVVELLKRTRDPVIRYNTARYLSTHTDFASPYETKKPEDQYDTWSRWWRRNKQRMSRCAEETVPEECE